MCNEIKYGRIVGGVAWPGNKPGYAVIIGEELLPRIGSNIYNFHLLAEVEEQLLERLIERCVSLAIQYKVECFYGSEHKPYIQFIDKWNEDKARRFEFNIAMCSKEGQIAYHINVLLKRLTPGNKTLHLGNSKIAGYLDIPAEEIHSATDSDYPAIAALGYAVSELDYYKPINYDDEDNNDDEDIGRDPVTGY